MRWSYFCAPSLILHMLEFVIRSVFETMLCFKLNTNNIINKNGEDIFSLYVEGFLIRYYLKR